MSLLALLRLLYLLPAICPLGWVQGGFVGGYAPVPYYANYIVSIQTSDGQHVCGGYLINRYWVMTAAHCNIGPKQLQMVARDYSLNQYEWTKQDSQPHSLLPQPLYKKGSTNADIMFIKLKTHTDLNRYVPIAPLPWHGEGVPEGRVCRLSGWGQTDFNVGRTLHTRRTVQLHKVSADRRNFSASFNREFTGYMLCAGYAGGGKDSCTVCCDTFAWGKWPVGSGLGVGGGGAGSATPAQGLMWVGFLVGIVSQRLLHKRWGGGLFWFGVVGMAFGAMGTM